jgi:hypothetical protein
MSVYKTTKAKNSCTNLKNLTEYHFNQVCMDALRRVRKNKEIE